MNWEGFSSEWMTVGDVHRVLISCRNGFPRSSHREILRDLSLLMVAKLSPEARIVSAFDNDKAGVFTITIGSTEPADVARAEGLRDDLNDLYPLAEHGFNDVVIRDVTAGNVGSDHYDHMRHIAEMVLTGKTSYPRLAPMGRTSPPRNSGACPF